MEKIHWGSFVLGLIAVPAVGLLGTAIVAVAQAMSRPAIAPTANAPTG